VWCVCVWLCVCVCVCVCGWVAAYLCVCVCVCVYTFATTYQQTSSLMFISKQQAKCKVKSLPIGINFHCTLLILTTINYCYLETLETEIMLLHI